MARIEFPNGFEGVEDLPRSRKALRNCFNNGQGRIISRPGITELNTTGGTARGQFVWRDSLYQVSSERLIKINDPETGAFTIIGTIAGAERVETAIGFNSAVIVVKGGAIYDLDEADVLTEIGTNPNFVPCVDVAYINGRFVYIPSNGDPAFFSDVGDAGTVQPESFFDAEELPDLNNSVFNLKNTLYIGGTDSFELFRDTGADPNPFQRVQGARINYGYVGGLIDFTDTFMFIGRATGQDYGIYAIGQGTAQKLSNEAIDRVLSGYTPTELALALDGRLRWRGYDIATFTLADDSFGFLNGAWFILDTVEGGNSRPWQAGYITQLDGKYYTAYEEKIGVFAKVNTDYGERITRIIDTGFEDENDDYFACQSIELGISQGFNPSVGSVALFMSRDNVTYGEPVYRELGAQGQYGKHLIWNYPGGMGSYDGFMGVRIYTTEDVVFSANHFVANFR